MPCGGGPHARGHGIDDLELDIIPRSGRLEEPLAHIFAEQLARQEGVGQAFMQALVVLALVELAKRPVEEVAGLSRAHRKVAGAYIEKMQGMMRAVGDAPSERQAGLDHDETERPLDTGEAGDGGRHAGESAADHAHREWRPPHLALSFSLELVSIPKPDQNEE